MQGSGLIEYRIKREKQQVGIDVSGNLGNSCYRNDASIMLFLANSYYESSSILLKTIGDSFDSQKEAKEIMKYVLPFMFNSRHYFELELKGLVMMLDSKHTPITHNISGLINELKLRLCSYDYTRIDNPLIKENEFNNGKATANKLLNSIETNILSFISDEPIVEYYRYIFDNKYSIADPQIDFDYKCYSTLFKSIRSDFIKLKKELHCSGIQIFNP